MGMFKKEKEFNYFEAFIECADYTIQSSNKLLEIGKDFKNINKKAEELLRIEHAADEFNRKIYKELNVSFMTPIDREDIFDIINHIDDINDNAKEFANKCIAMDVKDVRIGYNDHVNLLVEATNLLKSVMIEFKNFKKSKYLDEKTIELKKIEQEADKIYLNALHNLFTTEKNPVEIIKWRELYRLLEDCFDACEDVIHDIGTVILKNS